MTSCRGCSVPSSLSEDVYAPYEEKARRRLHERAAVDWPLLAAAFALSGDVWSNDRDLFGVGVPVWSTRTVRFATDP